jgi:hypothetical protein
MKRKRPKECQEQVVELHRPKTLLVIVPGSTVMQPCVFDILVADTGEHLAAHFCSNSTFAYNDLYGTRAERKEAWQERFGEVEVKFIDETELSLEELIERNKNYKNGTKDTTH